MHSSQGVPYTAHRWHRCTLEALRAPQVLVVSLWTADDVSWLDGGCDYFEDDDYPQCELERSRFTQCTARGALSAQCTAPH